MPDSNESAADILKRLKPRSRRRGQEASADVVESTPPPKSTKASAPKTAE